MDERIIQFRIGVTALSAVLVTGILLIAFGGVQGVVRGTYPVFVKFRSAPGVSQDTPVRKSGILIGRVTKVQFAPDNDVLVTCAIDKGIELFRDEVVKINAGFLGNAVIEFVPGQRQPPQRIPIEPNDLLAGSVSVDPLQALANLEGNLNQAAGALADAGSEVGKLAKSVNGLLDMNDDKINRIIDETEATMLSFQRVLNNVDDIIGDDKIKDDLKQSLAELPQLFKDTRDTITGLQRAVALADNNLQNMQTFTKALDERGEGIVDNIDSSVERLDTLLEQVNRFSRALNSREGSLGQLINNPELYNNLSAAAENMNRRTRELEPILYNAKVLTDKLARHPGVILTDAVKPGPGIK